jgi:hypothetical protein
MPGSLYFDRAGAPITFDQWAALSEDSAYLFVARTWIVPETLEVVTLWEGFDPYRDDYEAWPPQIFRVAEVTWERGTVKSAREELFATEVEALAEHQALVERLRASTSSS